MAGDFWTIRLTVRAMRQILQNLGSGETILAEVPCPSVRPGHLLIQTRKTLISPGTERMLIDFGKANLIQKALQQPERVKQVLAKIKTDGLMPTISAVQAKLDQPIPLGYSNVGTVLEVGEGVFQKDQLMAVYYQLTFSLYRNKRKTFQVQFRNYCEEIF